MQYAVPPSMAAEGYMWTMRPQQQRSSPVWTLQPCHPDKALKTSLSITEKGGCIAVPKNIDWSGGPTFGSGCDRECVLAAIDHNVSEAGYRRTYHLLNVPKEQSFNMWSLLVPQKDNDEEQHKKAKEKDDMGAGAHKRPHSESVRRQPVIYGDSDEEEQQQQNKKKKCRAPAEEAEAETETEAEMEAEAHGDPVILGMLGDLKTYLIPDLDQVPRAVIPPFPKNFKRAIRCCLERSGVRRHRVRDLPPAPREWLFVHERRLFRGCVGSDLWPAADLRDVLKWGAVQDDPEKEKRKEVEEKEEKGEGEKSGDRVDNEEEEGYIRGDGINSSSDEEDSVGENDQDDDEESGFSSEDAANMLVGRNPDPPVYETLAIVYGQNVRVFGIRSKPNMNYALAPDVNVRHRLQRMESATPLHIKTQCTEAERLWFRKNGLLFGKGATLWPLEQVQAMMHAT